ncbi:DUF3291 domain-containing protein [Azospirillum soli]|uniref:DUF3291 domain-containing protein n=1 Tax=Azospirillum soli TaxID=1304799 RepID=UPI001AE74036|nr:DUF3291 domain-containing protein [Azospirillum soli]MBP2314295.1 hypothetical protein [Azospirillum soli]
MSDCIALMTFSILRAPYGDSGVQDFDDRTPDVFVEAERTPGFIDRAKPVEDIPWMTNFQKDWGRWGPFAVPRFYLGGTTRGHTRQAQTLSLWRDLGSVWRYTYQGPMHRGAFKERTAWFGPQNWPIYCVWWTREDELPNWKQACKRLEHLHDHGPTAVSFTFREPFDAAGNRQPLARLVEA